MVSKRFRKMCELYKIFAQGWNCDFSEEAMEEMYHFESTGQGQIDITGFNTIGKLPNGYAVGKKWLNVSVSGWRDELEGWKQNPFRHEIQCITDSLWEDPTFKDYHDWLLDVLNLRKPLQELMNQLNDLKKISKHLDKH